MTEKAPRLRRDLEFITVQQGVRKMVIVRDQLGLIPEGKAVDLSVYRILTLLDGTKTIRDLQMELMRQRGGVLVGSEEVASLLSDLDDSYLLDSERYRKFKEQMILKFAAEKIRPCFLCGRSYPNNALELKQTLDNILAKQKTSKNVEGKIRAIVAPHIDLSTGANVYAYAYGVLSGVRPCCVIVLGIGHHMTGGMFCLTEKDYATPLGVVRNETAAVDRLKRAGSSIIVAHDFEHRSEHSIEFQILFLQHLLGTETFTAVPILCGSLMANLTDYSRSAYLKKAGLFLNELKNLLQEREEEVLIVVGADFSHIGPKFGHDRPAAYMESTAEAHDKKLLDALCEMDADVFWEESRKVEDRFNVCGFPALACLLEVLPSSKGTVLGYQMRHEAATQSAVSFSAVVFTQ
ncbi:MAG: AmmeMemoRadiSam system protein B [Deltaproteobacteria bacterium]|nr:AmmeMemoRadiSam system protein B [Deltaproteobacteria bacterium]